MKFTIYDLPSNRNGEIKITFLIRKKGKIWISDLENYNELIAKLTTEISNFNSANKLSA